MNWLKWIIRFNNSNDYKSGTTFVQEETAPPRVRSGIYIACSVSRLVLIPLTCLLCPLQVYTLLVPTTETEHTLLELKFQEIRCGGSIWDAQHVFFCSFTTKLNLGGVLFSAISETVLLTLKNTSIKIKWLKPCGITYTRLQWALSSNISIWPYFWKISTKNYNKKTHTHKDLKLLQLKEWIDVINPGRKWPHP